MKFSAVILACLLSTTSAINLAAANGISTQTLSNAKVMEKVFMRSGDTHKQSMESILNIMSLDRAVQSLKKSNILTPELMQVSDMGKGKLSQNLRTTLKANDKLAQLDKAREKLNELIYESAVKYDSEVTRCKNFYAQHCGEMERVRGEIASSNFLAATTRKQILASQSTINNCEVDIPRYEVTLKEHKSMSKRELSDMNKRLQSLEGDIEVLTNITRMTECDKSKAFLIQTEPISMMHCTDKCTKKSFIHFNDDGLQNKINKLQSSHGLMQDTFKDLLTGADRLQSTEFLQTDAEDSPVVNKTKFNNPKLPQVTEPGDPCKKYANKGGVTNANKRAAKCTLGPGNCETLTERFMLMQTAIKDEKEDLLSKIAKMTEDMDARTKTLEQQITDATATEGNAQTDLADATKQEALAGEKAHKTAVTHEQSKKELTEQMKTCSGRYIDFEGELCALKKIRGELYKMTGNATQSTRTFEDCVVGEWQEGPCLHNLHDKGSEAVCGGGTQKISRNIMIGAEGGAKCLPLQGIRNCNNQPCSRDCVENEWTDNWSACSAECGSGVRQRVRSALVKPSATGAQCVLSQTESCNNQACSKDCVLSVWTPWSTCSKDCDGGTAKRLKFEKIAAKGAGGTCASRWSRQRLEYKKCNSDRCQRPAGATTLTCDKKLDIVLLIDGSSSLGHGGWEAEKKAALLFVDAFRLSSNKHQAQMSVILYSGPRWWWEYHRCFSKRTKFSIKRAACRIKTITSLTGELNKVKKLIEDLKWPKGGTLTSLALLKAKIELSNGRADAKSDVIVITDGKPMSRNAVGFASRLVRKSARLLWVPVTRYAPTRIIRKWASRRWQENVVFAKSFAELDKPSTVDHIIADICVIQHWR